MAVALPMPPVPSVTSRAPSAGTPLSIVVPRGLAPGAYDLKVWGVGGAQNESEVAHFRFDAVK